MWTFCANWLHESLPLRLVWGSGQGVHLLFEHGQPLPIRPQEGRSHLRPAAGPRRSLIGQHSHIGAPSRLRKAIGPAAGGGASRHPSAGGGGARAAKAVTRRETGAVPVASGGRSPDPAYNMADLAASDEIDEPPGRDCRPDRRCLTKDHLRMPYRILGYCPCDAGLDACNG